MKYDRHHKLADAETAQAFLQYVQSYCERGEYENLSMRGFIHDMLYGIGISVDEDEFSFAQGYDRWKRELIDQIKADLECGE